MDIYSTLTTYEVNRTNYIFAGWYTDSEYEQIFVASTQIISDTTLYAKWVQLKYQGDESQLVQYVNRTNPVKFYIDLTGSISWYVNNSKYIVSGPTNEFNYTPDNICGEYVITCEINKEKSNPITIMVYAVPTQLVISSNPNANGEVELSISNSEYINGSNCVWMKKYTDGTTEQIGIGTKILTQLHNDYEIYVIYQDINSNVMSNIISLPDESSNTWIWIIVPTILGLVTVGVFIYLKVVKPRHKKVPTPPTEPVKEPTTKSKTTKLKSDVKLNPKKSTNTAKPKTTKPSTTKAKTSTTKAKLIGKKK